MFLSIFMQKCQKKHAKNTLATNAMLGSAYLACKPCSGVKMVENSGKKAAFCLVCCYFRLENTLFLENCGTSYLLEKY
jgi:hypothetical protein